MAQLTQGSRIPHQALKAGYNVTAFVRNAAKLDGEPHLKTIQGDARNAEAVTNAMPDHEAVINALGSSSKQRPPDIISVGHATSWMA